MSAEDPRWREVPVLRAFHDQWWRARGAAFGEFSRPFTRDWEQLLEDAGLVSADHRADAERDARRLAEAALWRLVPDRRRPHLIARVQLPLENESRLATLFGDPRERPGAGLDPTSVAWEPELAFLRNARAGVAVEDFAALNRFLVEGGRGREVVPLKERSLEIFGDEKRFDALLATAPFREGRVRASLWRCAVVAEPLGWRRGPHANGPVLVIENASTWDSFARWNAVVGRWSAVVYGKGLVFADAVERMAEIFTELGGPRPVEYFGDLDPPGVEIPWRASRKAVAAGLPAVTPSGWCYRRLLEAGKDREGTWEGEPVRGEALGWLGDLAEPARVLFERHARLAQEHVGWDVLRHECV